MKRAVMVVTFCGLVLCAYLTAALCSAGLVSLERAAVALHDSDRFAVVPDRVAVEGLQRLTRDEVLLLTGLDRRVSWFDVDEHRTELFVRSNGWIKSCAVRAVFPDRVRITITEYEPAIVVNKRETGGERGEALYGIWFADRDGVVFKKAFPRENRGDIPLFFVESEPEPGRQKALVQQAIAVAAAWERHRDVCALRSIGYDAIEGFSLECEFPRHRISRILLGDIGGDGEVTRRSDLFRQAADRLRARRLFAGEYLFEKRRGDAALVAGQVVHYRD